MDDLLKKIEALELAIARIEESDRLQSAQIKKIVLAFCALVLVALGGGYLSSLSEENRDLLERLAFGVVAAGLSAGAGLPFLTEDKQ